MSWSDARKVRLRTLFARRDITGRSDLPMLSVYRDYGVVPREGRDDNYNKPGEDPSAYRVVHRGDLVLNKMKTWQGSLGISDHEGTVSPAYFVARPLTDDSPAFLHHLLRSPPLIAEYAARSKGIRPSQWDLPWDEFRNIVVDLPPIATQRAIADYLDRETARIDALIAAKRRMVELLDERLQETVSEMTHSRCVASRTHRLPDNWSLIPLKRCLASTAYGIGEASQAEGIYAVLGMSNIGSGEVVGEPGGFVSLVDKRLLLASGDLLFNRTNSRELVGKVGLVRSLDQPTTFASYLVRLRVNKQVGAQYLNYLLNSREVLGLARSTALPSIGQANLNPTRYSAMLLPIPPVEEQRRIVSSLNALASRTVDIRHMLERQAILLRERRQALITAAVTGQPDIPVQA